MQNKFTNGEDGVLHDGGGATFDRVLLCLRATIFSEQRGIDECTSNEGSSMEELIELMHQKITSQNELMENQGRRFLKQLERQVSINKAQIKALMSAVDKTNTVASTFLHGATSSFVQFDPLSELWTDYWARFYSFVCAHCVSNDRKAHFSH